MVDVDSGILAGETKRKVGKTVSGAVWGDRADGKMRMLLIALPSPQSINLP